MLELNVTEMSRLIDFTKMDYCVKGLATRKRSRSLTAQSTAWWHLSPHKSGKKATIQRQDVVFHFNYEATPRQMEFLKNFAAGTLSDGQIKAGCAEGWLICDKFDPKCVMQACYELRAGNVYYELDGIDGKSAPVRIELNANEFILLKPKQLITVITLEFLKLPDNVLGRVLTKGKLFSVGLVPVNTYADPGFSGRLGIVIANLSYNYIAIRQGQPIAKIEFSKLRNTVEQSYSGQHGYQTEMWPVPNEMILSRESLIAAGDKRVLSIEEELALTNGKIIGGVANRIFAVERKLLFVTILYLVFSTALIGYMASQGNQGAISQVVSLLLGVISNAVFWAITYSATNIFRK